MHREVYIMFLQLCWDFFCLKWIINYFIMTTIQHLSNHTNSIETQQVWTCAILGISSTTSAAILTPHILCDALFQSNSPVCFGSLERSFFPVISVMHIQSTVTPHVAASIGEESSELYSIFYKNIWQIGKDRRMCFRWYTFSGFQVIQPLNG